MADNVEKRKKEAEKSTAHDSDGIMDVDKTNDSLVPRGDRRRQAEAGVKLLVAGANYTEIAQTLDFPSPSHARNAIERLLADSVSEDDRAQGRWLANQRLSRVMRSLYPYATNNLGKDENGKDIVNPDHIGYARTYLAFLDRQIKLQGLDAPSELNVSYKPHQDEFNKTVKEIISQMRGEFPDEEDILDAEVVDE